MKCALRIDYATFNLPADVSDADVCLLLAGRDDLFRKKPYMRENACLVSPMGLHWMPNTGYAALPRRLQISGVGCEHFYPTMPALRAKYRDNMTISRCDFAFDIFMSISDWRKFLQIAFAESMNDNRQRKRFTLISDRDASTIYIGNRDRKGAKLMRIYNKSLENERFDIVDDRGSVVDCPEGYYIIRYEIQCMRYVETSPSRGRKVFDPGVLFDLYFGDDTGFAELVDFIKKSWVAYAHDLVLPEDFANFEFFCYKRAKDKFCSKQGSVDPYIRVSEKLGDYPHTFDRTLFYIVSKFGKYIPYVVHDGIMWQQCATACMQSFGFLPPVTVLIGDYGFTELPLQSTPWDDYDIPYSWDKQQIKISEV